MTVPASQLPSHAAPRPLVIVVSGLEAGGTERVAVSLAAWLAGNQAQYAPSILTIEGPDRDFYDPAPVPRRSAWPEGRHGRQGIRTVLRVRDQLTSLEPAIVLGLGSFAAVVALGASLGSRWKVVVSERNHQTKAVSRAVALGRRLLYPRADALVSLTSAGTPWLQRLSRGGRVVVIPNAYAPTAVGRQLDRKPQGPKRILTVGRLHEQKAQDDLIRAYASLDPSIRSAWMLRIVGDGPLRGELEKLARTLQVDVELAPPTTNIADEYANAEVFVLPSRIEGFPNVLIEAMASELPVIASDLAATREVITHGRSGVLVPAQSPLELRNALSTMLSDARLRQEFGVEAAKRARDFTEVSVFPKWLQLLQTVDPA